MANHERVNDILGELNNNPKVITSLVISRSGMHIAGPPPAGVHLETFIAMAAVLISAAESVSSGLKGKLENVFLELDRSRVIIDNVGNKGILVVVTNTKDDHDSLYEQVIEVIRELTSLI
jgi:predicted regulator of Ras-like GTPase activity (Roadblock/LC7/MglB family)